METDEVTGLMLGADDYVTKPFRLAVLRARVIALLRRGRPFGLYEEDEFRFDFERLCFTRKGKEIVLSVNEQRLLKCLVEGRGSVLTRERLIDYLRGEGFVWENGVENGWCAVLIDGIPCGGGKIVNGYVKNHYPKGLRTQ